MPTPRPIGIDLGTTNSVAAALVDGRPQILGDERGHSRVPSYVAWRDGEFIVGEGAKDLVLTYPQATVHGVKRLIGRRFDSKEAEDARKRMAYTITEALDGGCLVGLGDHNFTPVDVCAVLLKQVKENAERIMGAEATEGVITIPAHFTHAQRQATLDAAELAGLKCERLIHEPTAAALAYAQQAGNTSKTFMVFDLGGGTFDVTILRRAADQYEVLATYGDTYLGGEDFDYRLVDWMAERFKAEHGVDPWEDKVAVQRMKKAAEQAKLELSARTSTDIAIPMLADQKHLRESLTRDQMEDLVGDLAFRTVQIASGTVEDAGLQVSEIDEILLVGGQTRMPLIREGITSMFNKEPSAKVNPDQVVAIGAAIFAAGLSSTTSSIFIDVIPFAIGLEVAAGAFQPIFGKYEQVPTQHAKSFVTQTDNQESIMFIVRQGNHRKAAENEFLAQYIIRGLHPAARMETQVRAIFSLNENVQLKVTAEDANTGQPLEVETRNYAEMKAERDKLAKKRAEQKRQAQNAAPPPRPEKNTWWRQVLSWLGLAA